MSPDPVRPEPTGPDPEQQRPTPQPEEEFKIIDFGRILRYMGLALLAMAVLGAVIVGLAYLLVK